MASPEVWGPFAWKILHSASFDADARSFALLVEALQLTIPCKHCKSSFQYYCKKVPLQCMEASADCDMQAKWAWKLHDSVNLKLDKTPRLPFSTLQRRKRVFGLTVTADDVFGLIFVALLQGGEPATYAPALALRIAACFPTSDFASFLRAPVKGDLFSHFVAQKRAYSVSKQCPIETAGQVRERCSAASASFVSGGVQKRR